MNILAMIISGAIGFIFGLLINILTPLSEVLGKFIVTRFKQLEIEIKEDHHKKLQNGKYRSFLELTIRCKNFPNTIESIALIAPVEAKAPAPVFSTKSRQMIELPLKMGHGDTAKLYYLTDFNLPETAKNYQNSIAELEFRVKDTYKQIYNPTCSINFKNPTSPEY